MIKTKTDFQNSTSEYFYGITALCITDKNDNQIEAPIIV